MSDKYNVYFRGEVQDGENPLAVRSRLASLFNADKETLDRLFSGKAQLIKKACDKETALKFKQALENAGAIPIVKRAAESGAATPDDTWSLAPAGAELLTGAERDRPHTAEVDTSALSVAAAGERLSTAEESTAQPPDTSHLSTAEQGPIPNLPGPEAIPEPDLSHIDLCPEQTDLSDCAAPSPEAPALNLDGLSVSEAGADLLSEAERATSSVEPPDVSHLALDPEGAPSQ